MASTSVGRIVKNMTAIKIVDDAFCKKNNCRNYEIHVISRGVSGAVEIVRKNEDHDFSAQVAIALPIGNPPKHYATFLRNNGNGVLSVFATQQNATFGSFQLDPLPDFNTVIESVSSLLETLTDLLEQLETEKREELTVSLAAQPPLRFDQINHFEIPNLSYALYNLLTGKKIILIGTMNKILQGIWVLSNLIDGWFPMPSFSINFTRHLELFDIIAYDENGQEEITKLSQDHQIVGQAAIINYSKEQVLGAFDSPLCHTLAGLLAQDITLAKEMVGEIVKMSKMASKYPDSETMADEQGLDFPDADLLWEVHRYLEKR